MTATNSPLIDEFAPGSLPADAPPWLRPRAAYVHIPFCAHHCGYCDFAVAAGRDSVIDLYLEALETELATLCFPYSVRTLFLGGGTPTYPPPDRLDRMLARINHWLPRTGADCEFSIESTPESLTAEKVAILANHGIDRVSIGVQSFQPRLLRALDRWHTPAQVPVAVDIVRSRIARISLDLIFGIPGQTLADWKADLAQALALEPEHLSLYGLTYEKGTPLWKHRERGQVQPVSEDDERAFFETAREQLEQAGFRHYEISNYARPGAECRHNTVYWANHAYLGFGVGAARYVNGRRETNTRNLDRYLRCVLSGESATFQSECLSAEDRARETLAVQLRRAEGADRDAFRNQTGFAIDDLVGTAVARHVAAGWLADDGRSVRLTRHGQCVADSLIADLF